jgi:superfamily II DNA or RNA helicase
MAIGVICEIKKPTVVVVAQDFLVNQWRQRIATFAPKARIGIIQGDRCEYGKDYDVSIAMLQSLVRRKDSYPSDMWKSFGLAITDEVHRVSAATWSETVPLFNSEYRLGVSATPRRKDGTENVFFWHIGPVIYKSTVKRMVPKLRRVFTGFDFYRSRGFDPASSSRETQIRMLCSDKARNELIVSELKKASDAGRKVIVLSERRKHLEVIQMMFNHIKKTECVVDYYVGGRPQEELDIAEGANVILSTYQMAKEALDIPALDTAFLVTPSSDVEQAVGRIMREHESKKEPVVVDFVDSKISRWSQQFEKRLAFYKREGMFIKD